MMTVAVETSGGEEEESSDDDDSALGRPPVLAVEEDNKGESDASILFEVRLRVPMDRPRSSACTCSDADELLSVGFVQ